MEAIQRIAAAPTGDEQQRLFDIFFDIERKARLSGNAGVLLRLDRIPGALLDPTDRIGEGPANAVLAQAFEALEAILSDLERPPVGQE